MSFRDVKRSGIDRAVLVRTVSKKAFQRCRGTRLTYARAHFYTHVYSCVCAARCGGRSQAAVLLPGLCGDGAASAL